MTPEAGAFLAKAQQMLGRARMMLGADLPEEAARAAYMAAFHAAQALIFERHGVVAKTHRGVQASFNRLALAERGIDAAHRAFLGQGYAFKTIADYETDPAATISPALAATALDDARRFVAAVGACIA